MTRRVLIRVLAVDYDDIPLDSEDHDPVHVWILIPQYANRRAFLTQGSKLIESWGMEVNAENAVSLVGQRFWVVLETLPAWEQELAERIPFLDAEPVESNDDLLRTLGYRAP